MSKAPPGKEVRVAPNIYRTATGGWRVYVWRQGVLKPVRFKPEVTLDELIHFRDTFKLESKRLRRTRQQAKASTEAADKDTFTADAARYLALNTVKAMPSFRTREIEIKKWVHLFGRTPRKTITTRMIDEHLQSLRSEGYSGSTINKFRTALMALWTRLDGRSAANPVKDTAMFDEAPMVPRGQSYDLLTRILDVIPEDKGRGVKGQKGSRGLGSLSRARLEVLAWTGMDPSQLGRMTPADVSITEGWYITPPRQKGTRRRRTPRPVIKKPMSPETVNAFKRFIRLEAWGLFDTHSLLKTWLRAIGRLQKQLRKNYDDETFTLPHIRLKDIRHSFGTKLYEQTENLGIVGQMLDHAPGSPMTLRYSLGGVPTVLRGHMDKFTGRKRPKAAARGKKTA